MERNILLTTLGNTFDYSRHNYFTYIEGGNQRYCEGISTAEAGAKYILSKVAIDKIIVLGPSSEFRDENTREEVALRDYCDYSAAVPEMYSEYKFFCYRIMQFLNRVDIEGNDLLDEIRGEERKEILDAVHAFCEQKGLKKEGERLDETFHRLNLDQRFFEEMVASLPDMNRKKTGWLKHYLFMLLHRSHKMDSLDLNEDITVQFVPTIPKGENNLRMGNLPNILDTIMEGNRSAVNVYVDLQGMDIADSHTLINVLFTLQNEKTKNIDIREIITTTYHPTLFTSPIENQKERLELSELLSGMDAFLQYGKVYSIQRYWNSRNIQDEHIDKLIYAMRTVDVGITLCSVSEMEQGIKMLKMVFADESEPSDAIESMVFSILESGIKSDYGRLLKGEEINILALIKWAMEKHFYQQALTIIESRVPHDLVCSGIFYYARNKKDLEEYLKRMNETYWSVVPKDRYQFDDMEHYFIKFYRRKEAYRKKPKVPIEAYLNLRLDEIYKEDSKVRSYSLYRGDRETLYEFLMAYMQIGNLRNQISHAQEININSVDWDTGHENEKIQILRERIYDFIKLYEKVRTAIDRTSGRPYLISQEEFKQYCKDHPITWEELRAEKEKKKNQEKDS